MEKGAELRAPLRGLTRAIFTGRSTVFRQKTPFRENSTTTMALKIKLSRFGATHTPAYRVVVSEARYRRDGAAVENLGTYTPKTKGNPINLNLERVDYWISKGAKPCTLVQGRRHGSYGSACVSCNHSSQRQFVRAGARQSRPEHGTATTAAHVNSCEFLRRLAFGAVRDKATGVRTWISRSSRR